MGYTTIMALTLDRQYVYRRHRKITTKVVTPMIGKMSRQRHLDVQKYSTLTAGTTYRDIPLQDHQLVPQSRQRQCVRQLNAVLNGLLSVLITRNQTPNTLCAQRQNSPGEWHNLRIGSYWRKPVTAPSHSHRGCGINW
jgi:hypothetical protein